MPRPNGHYTAITQRAILSMSCSWRTFLQNLVISEPSASTIDSLFDNVELLSFDMISEISRLRFFVVYRSPHHHSEHIKLLTNCLYRYTCTSKTHSNIVTGDYYCPGINWITLHSQNDGVHNTFLDYVISAGLSQCVNFSMWTKYSGFTTYWWCWVEQGLTSHQTHYRSYRGRVLWVKIRNQQCQSTEGREVLRTSLQSHYVHPTVLTITQHICSTKKTQNTHR